MKLTWDNPKERFYMHGIDRGVLYPAKLSAVDPGPTVTNLWKNPSFEVDTSAWALFSGSNAPVRENVRAFSGSWSLHVKRGAGTSGQYASHDLASMLPGAGTYRISVRMWIPSTSGGNNGIRLGGAGISPVVPDVYTTVRGAWVEVAATFTWNGTGIATLYIMGTATTSEAWVDAIILTAGSTIRSYFDGSSVDGQGYTYDWTGTADASTSNRIGPPVIPPENNPTVWNGLTGMDESGGGATSMLFRDGIIYLADVDPGDFTGKLDCIYYPDQFGHYMGIPQVSDGLFADNQKPKRFHLSYRTLVGSGVAGDTFGYQIHLVYNCMASMGNRSRKTLGEKPEATDFSFDIVATPVKMPGLRPTAHYIIDTRYLSDSIVAAIERTLYGDDFSAGTLPEPTALFELLNFGDAIVVTDHQDGTLTISGSYTNVHLIDEETAEVNNINAVVNTDGTVVISDGENTTIVQG